MPEPTYSSFTERYYVRLPEFLRIADANLGWPLKAYISLVGDGAGEIEDEINDWLDTGSLADPELAPVAALPWLAQLVGVRLPSALTEVEQRDAIVFASAGWRAGTKSAVADAARSALTGTKHAEVYDHTVSSPGDGGMWDVLLVTRFTETPDPSAVLAAVIAKGAKPAGVILHHRNYGASWATVEADRPTWADWALAGSWAAIEETGL